MPNWAVIACDQFTSQPEYWRNVAEISGEAPSAYNLIIPESELECANDSDIAKKISRVNSQMKNYIEAGIFHTYENCYIYVERTLLNGEIRRGIVGVIDLEEYDYRPGKFSRIRATEKTVSERIPTRKKIRENALLELSHVILLCDDPEKNLIESVTLVKNNLRRIYDFDLMLNGGNIRAWLLDGKFAESFDERMQNYIAAKKAKSLTFAVGDGNHSLAAAKACYLENPEKISRYATVELENIHDDALKFEPIHRIVKNIQPEKFLENMRSKICDESSDLFLKYYYANESGILRLKKNHGASVLNILQNFLDEELTRENNFEIDYIHDLDALKKLSNEDGNLGFEMPEFSKSGFFDAIEESGTLPRKTFSMGHAQEKRYYIEARIIRKACD